MWPTTVTIIFLLLILARCIPEVFSIPQHITYSPSQPLSISLSKENVSLGESVTIRCHINSRSEEGALMTQSSMNLYCPVNPKNIICFQNCQPVNGCNGRSDCPALEGVTCRSITQSDGEIVYEYTVEHVTPEWMDWRHPGFSCRSALIQTKWIRLYEKAVSPSVERKTSAETTTTTTTSTSTTTSTTTTTTTQRPRTTKPTPRPDTNETRSVIISSSNGVKEGKHWLNFLRNSSSGGIWTPEMIIIIALVALALSMLINCFCCLRWFVRRNYGNKRKLKGSDTFGCQNDLIKAAVFPSPLGWYPADPRMIPAGATLAPQQMTPSSAFRRSIAVPDGSLVDNPPLWCPYDGENAPRSHPEGKAANGSSLSNSGGRNSDSGFSLAHTISGPQPIQLIHNPGTHPVNFESVGWSGPGTPRSKHLAHRLRQQFVPEYYVGLKQANSRETVFSERPMSEMGFDSTSHHPHHYVPLVLGPGGTVRVSHPQLATMAGYGAPLCSPVGGSLIEKLGAGDGASARGGSGSPKPGMTVLLPATVIGHQYGIIPPPSSSTERSSAPLLKADLTQKSKAMINETTLEEPGNEETGKSAAKVQMWMESMPLSDKDHQTRLPTKLADSLNTDYDVGSDWSERDPMLMRDKPPSSNATATTD